MNKQAQRALLERFSGSAPRYTSYPTAPHFREKITPERHRDWLSRLPADATLSLYAHIPFCGTLCWFCACRSQGSQNYTPIARYLDHLMVEIETLSPIVAPRAVERIHWGGGSPTILSPEDILRLANAIRSRFPLTEDAEFAVEIDPRDMTEARLDALAEAGMTRASIGVQDFNPEVQAAINRDQSFEKTHEVLSGLRARGVESVNIDALYGLPLQSLHRLEETIRGVIALDPDRVALFGYAHVPWMAKRQKLIDPDTLPDTEARFEQAQRAAEMLAAAGYARVGLDHFAKPDDDLARATADGTLRRNFQGYTADTADALIGFGASAISRTPSGYIQNVSATAQYQSKVAEHGLAPARGVGFALEDRIRGAAIEEVMCRMAFDGEALIARFGDLARPVAALTDMVCAQFPAEIVERTTTGFVVHEEGRPFLRSMAAIFDAYLTEPQGDAPSARYSRAV